MATGANCTGSCACKAGGDGAYSQLALLLGGSHPAAAGAIPSGAPAAPSPAVDGTGAHTPGEQAGSRSGLEVAVSSRGITAAAAAFDFGDDFFLFHPPVLEPDGDLPLREVGGGGDLPPLVAGDELAAGVLLLQLLQLPLAVRDPLLAAPAEGAAVGGQLPGGVWARGETGLSGETPAPCTHLPSPCPASNTLLPCHPNSSLHPP